MLLYNSFGSGVVYLIMSALYLSAMFAICTVDINTMHNQAGDKQKSSTRNTDKSSHLKEAVSVEGTVWMIVYTAIYKCGECTAWNPFCVLI